MKTLWTTLQISMTLTLLTTTDNFATTLHDYKWQTIDNEFPTILQQPSADNNSKFQHDQRITTDMVNVEIDDDRKRSESWARQTADAVSYGFKALQQLIEIKEPILYRLGLYLDDNEPGGRLNRFGAPNRRAIELSRLGYASLEAHRKITETNGESLLGRQAAIINLLEDECPLRGVPRCPPTSRRYRTTDGSCNNAKQPWHGAALLPMQRFLPPVYHDGIQEIRRSVYGTTLPSPRLISLHIHHDNNIELPNVNLMLMQWGQLIDHDLTSTVKSRGFNGTIPRCCGVPPELLHPNCLPIEVPANDWNFAPFGVRCLEFTRSAPSTRINCHLGWREQLNQATSFLDASAIYGSDIETMDSIRTFRNGKLQYGRPRGVAVPPDPPNGELCRAGAITLDCFQSTDGRIGEQPGLIGLHTIWIRYHNKLATVLSQINDHWSDEKVFQETRRIIGALFQQITYREFLPIILGEEVMDLFGLNLKKTGYYQGYDATVNPTIANAFSTAAFRFGHSLVQNSFVRADSRHRPIFNNVTLHQEQQNVENIWSLGSLDRLILGFANQPSQRRDEFIADELTNHLFQTPGAPIGLDLASINIQRGRDHGLPSYTDWRRPCGLSPINTWSDLFRIMNRDTVDRLKSIYHHIDDLDLFTGGLAERPVRGGLVGPTFACIIAQQFTNLRNGDRFWYENGGGESSFTPAQLQQLRHITLAHVLCQTLIEIETIQPFVFLMANDANNRRLRCDDRFLANFDITPWLERDINEIGHGRFRRATKKTKKPPPTTTTTETPLRIKIKHVSTDTREYYVQDYVPDDIPQRPTYNGYANRLTTPKYDDITYLFDAVKTTTHKPTTPQQNPIEVNIKIQYYAPPTTTKRPKKKRKPTTATPTTTTPDYYDVLTYQRPTTTRPYKYTTPRYPAYLYYTTPAAYYDRIPTIDVPKRPTFGQYNTRPTNYYTIGHVERVPYDNADDQLDFKTKYVKISSVKGTETHFGSTYNLRLQLQQRENDDEPQNSEKLVRLVDIDLLPNENQWIIYNATDNDPVAVDSPKFDNFEIVSAELPKPITIRTNETTKT